MSTIHRRILLMIICALVCVARLKADRCRGVPLDPLSGSDAVVSWYSTALRQGTADRYCYERRVIVSRRLLVNWPKANIRNMIVERELTVHSCCYMGPRAESDELVYGISPTLLPTNVYRGQGEPFSATGFDGGAAVWMSIIGDPVIDGVPLHVDLTILVEQFSDHYRITWANGASAPEIELRFQARDRSPADFVLESGQRMVTKTSSDGDSKVDTPEEILGVAFAAGSRAMITMWDQLRRDARAAVAFGRPGGREQVWIFHVNGNTTAAKPAIKK